MHLILITNTLRKYLNYFVQVLFLNLFKIIFGVLKTYLNFFTRILLKTAVMMYSLIQSSDLFIITFFYFMYYILYANIVIYDD